MKTQLLCTFTNQKNLEQITHDITKNFDIVFNKIYVLQNEEKKPKTEISSASFNSTNSSKKKIHKKHSKKVKKPK